MLLNMKNQKWCQKPSGLENNQPLQKFMTVVSN